MGGVPRFTSFRFAVVVALEGVVGAVRRVSRRSGLRLLLLLKERWGRGWPASRRRVLQLLLLAVGSGRVAFHVVPVCGCCALEGEVVLAQAAGRRSRVAFGGSGHQVGALARRNGDGNDERRTAAPVARPSRRWCSGRPRSSGQAGLSQDP